MAVAHSKLYTPHKHNIFQKGPSRKHYDHFDRLMLVNFVKCIALFLILVTNVIFEHSTFTYSINANMYPLHNHTM